MKIAGRYYRVRWLTLLCVFAAGTFLAVLLLDSFTLVHGLILRSALGLLLVLAFLVLFLIAVRLVRFQGKARALLRRLVAGDYESGIRTSKYCKDEVCELEQLLNRLVEQLRQYDDLRSARIRQLRMTLGLVLEHTLEPMILFDVEKDMLHFNPAMSEILGHEKQSVQLDTLRNFETNRAFDELLKRATAEEESAQEGQIEIQLPGQDASTKVDARVVLYKDKTGSVPFAILFIKPLND